MSGVVIVRGVATDMPVIMPVMHAAFDPSFGESWTEAQCLGVLALPGTSLLVAHGPEPVGFALSRIVVGECELLLLAVARASQRRGVGRMLLERMIADARTAHVTSAHLEVRAGNGAAALYSSAGFREVGRRCGYYRASSGAMFDALTYRYDLS